MRYYPVAIRLRNKKAVVVGGGAVGERKILGLIEAGARVTVVSPELTAKLRVLVKNRHIRWIRRTVKKSDLKSARLVIAATSDRSVNKKVSAWARRDNLAVNVVDDRRLSDYISPAVIRQKKAIVAIYTDGKEPELSKDLKNFLKEHWDEFLSYRNRS